MDHPTRNYHQLSIHLWKGALFHRDIEGGRTRCTLQCLSDTLRATLDDGRIFDVDLRSSELYWGGDQNRILFCRSADQRITLFSDEQGFVFALLEASRGTVRERLLLLSQQAQRRKQFAALRWGLAALFVLGVIAGTGWAFAKWEQWMLPLIPDSVDRNIGQMARRSMPPDGRVIEEGAIFETVQEILSALSCVELSGSSHTLSLQVVDNAQSNAFALPGGYVTVYTGLLKRAQKPEHVAGVLAHELAHVRLRHGVSNLARSVGIIAAAQLLFGDVGGWSSVIVEGGAHLITQGYSRQAESAADSWAAQCLWESGIDPSALAEFFKLLKTQNDAQSGELKEGSWMQWISSHPALDSRISAIENWRQELEKEEGRFEPKVLPVDWESLSHSLESLQ